MKYLKYLAFAVLGSVLLLLGYIFFIVAPSLPALDKVTDYQPRIPLRIYTADGALMGEFGEEHRDFVAIDKIPIRLKQALLAQEDSRFYEHSGIDIIGVGRALFADLRGGYYQGASTITMQVARNFFLSREKTFNRKLKEVLLTYRIENALSKDQILELYMNQIYLGQRSYGFAAAARAYYGKTLDQMSLAESAMLIGIPKNPIRFNPVANYEKAKFNQQLVLKSMLKREMISTAEFDAAMKEKVAVRARLSYDVHADHAAEMVRQEIVAQYGEAAYDSGMKVYTTLSKAEQEAAYQALRRNVIAYDARHGYRGPEARIELPKDNDEREDAIDEILRKHPANGELEPAIVLEANPKKIKVELSNGESISLQGESLRLVTQALQAKADKKIKLDVGAVIRVMKDSKLGWVVTQLPEVEAAYVAIDAQTGAYKALVGGFDFGRKKFNHVTSALRQPGSSLKPFLYAAAIERGFYPGTMVNDVQLSETSDTSVKWDPRNDDGKYEGPVTLRYALAHSKNVVAVRVLQALGVDFYRKSLSRFGFDLNKQPNDLTLALGTGQVTAKQLVSAYAIFANGGYQVKPWLINRIVDKTGKVLFAEKEPDINLESNRVLDARTSFIMDAMMRDVTRYGTGAKANAQLGRTDLAGKTGTTSDAFDGWFAGYGAGVVAVSWMGYDDPKSLGSREFGSTLALPIWIDAMRVSLSGKAQSFMSPPEGVVSFENEFILAEFAEAGAIRQLDLPPQAVPEKSQEPQKDN